MKCLAKLTCNFPPLIHKYKQNKRLNFYAKPCKQRTDLRVYSHRGGRLSQHHMSGVPSLKVMNLSEPPVHHYAIRVWNESISIKLFSVFRDPLITLLFSKHSVFLFPAVNVVLNVNIISLSLKKISQSASWHMPWADLTPSVMALTVSPVFLFLCVCLFCSVFVPLCLCPWVCIPLSVSVSVCVSVSVSRCLLPYVFVPFGHFSVQVFCPFKGSFSLMFQLAKCFKVLFSWWVKMSSDFLCHLDVGSLLIKQILINLDLLMIWKVSWDNIFYDLEL